MEIRTCFGKMRFHEWCFETFAQNCKVVYLMIVCIRNGQLNVEWADRVYFLFQIFVAKVKQRSAREATCILAMETMAFSKVNSTFSPFSWGVLVFLIFCKILVSARFCLCSVDFLTFTLKLPIQTSVLSVAPELPVSLRSTENCQKLRKPNTALVPFFKT